VAYVDSLTFRVSIIPHTAAETTLLTMKCGEKVNLECDVIGKYVEKLLGFNQSALKGALQSPMAGKDNITEGFLKENGFF